MNTTGVHQGGARTFTRPRKIYYKDFYKGQKGIVMIFVILFTLNFVLAQPGQEPPREAIDACVGKYVEELCSFTGLGNDVIRGVCVNTLGNIFACMGSPETYLYEPAASDIQDSEVGFFKKIFNFLFGWMKSEKVDEQEEIETPKTYPKEGQEPLQGPEITRGIVDTAQTKCYNSNSEINCPSEGEDFYGQDGNYFGNQSSYTDNGDGTITDEVTGLMWQKDMGEKMTLGEAFEKAEELNFAGYNDWRVPTIKELYSLIIFTGSVSGEKAIDFFVDTDYFNQPLGDTSKGEREIDAQTLSSTEYVGLTMQNDKTIFGVNFVDGRIKGYGRYDPRTREEKKKYFRLVRGNSGYGENNFVDNGDGTITDENTNLIWQKEDSKKSLDWKGALNYCESFNIAGYDDWRLPNAKELQMIVDYSRSPQTTNSAAINPIFDISSITDPNGKKNYPFFWTSTTHLDGKDPESGAVYICFGECQGKMNDILMDVHGAGAQRSDPKSGNREDYPQYFGPQGDIRYVYNYVRCVR